MSESYFMLKFIRKRRMKRLRTGSGENKDITVKNADNFKCRICLKNAEVPIFGDVGTFDIADAINFFAGVEISKDDLYPKHLCTLCHEFLQKAISFRQSAKETDQFLKETKFIDTKSNFDVESHDSDTSLQNTIISRDSYKCKLCKLNFNSIDELSIHKTSKSHKNVRIQCSICLGLLTPQAYKKHLLRHQSASHLICDICGKLYRKDNLVRHLQSHSYELPFQCQICPYRGRFMESLKLHMRTHTGDKPFSCDKCDLRFLTRSNLNRHLLTHRKERPYKCTECGRGFYMKSDVYIHFKADHAGLKNFTCRVCGNKYGTRKALMRHELRVHKRDKMAKGRLPLYLQAEYQNYDECFKNT